MFNRIKVKNEIYKNYGEWIEPQQFKTMDLYSPVNEEIIHKVTSVNQETVDLAIKAARVAQKQWVKIPVN